MARSDVLTILKSQSKSPLEFNFDSLWIYPMDYYLSPYDIKRLNEIATSIKLASKIDTKYKMIDEIMVSRGFKRFAGGTNRVIYRHMEDTRFVAKVAIDRVGLQDNPLEYYNQQLLKPYCAKTFCVSPCGTVAFSERLLPITRKAEFAAVANDVFDILVMTILGKYVVDDVGSKYFLNWAIRMGVGPALIDYPYVYQLDGAKLYCSKILDDGSTCNGEIDYDDGFNYLRCLKCGKRYFARDLRNNTSDNKIIIKKGGLTTMKVQLMRGNEPISSSIRSSDVIVNPGVPTRSFRNDGMKVCLKKGDKIIGADTNVTETQQPKEVAEPRLEVAPTDNKIKYCEPKINITANEEVQQKESTETESKPEQNSVEEAPVVEDKQMSTDYLYDPMASCDDESDEDDGAEDADDPDDDGEDIPPNVEGDEEEGQPIGTSADVGVPYERSRRDKGGKKNRKFDDDDDDDGVSNSRYKNKNRKR